MAYNVLLSESARAFFRKLVADNRLIARELALVLLSLRQEPEPPGSRELEPLLIDPSPGERVWERLDWIITYKVDPLNRIVAIAMIEGV